MIKLVHRSCAELGISKFGPGHLRHANATARAMRLDDLVKIKDALGHAAESNLAETTYIDPAAQFTRAVALPWGVPLEHFTQHKAPSSPGDARGKPESRQRHRGLLRAAGFEARSFPSGDDFLKSTEREMSACLILDVRMPGMSGIELQRRLAERGSRIPFVFVSAHPDRETRLRALEGGAVAFLEKPLTHEGVLDAVAAAMSISRR